MPQNSKSFNNFLKILKSCNIYAGSLEPRKILQKYILLQIGPLQHYNMRKNVQKKMKILIAHAKKFRNGKTNLKNLFQTPLLIFPLPPKNIKKLDFS